MIEVVGRAGGRWAGNEGRQGQTSAGKSHYKLI